MKSWQTTVAGVAVIVAALTLVVAKGLTPESMALLMAGAGLIVAQDDKSKKV